MITKKLCGCISYVPSLLLGCYQFCENIYQNLIQSAVVYVTKDSNSNSVHLSAKIVGTLVSEPYQTTKLVYFSLFSFQDELENYGINPKFLTQKQAKASPILLLPGFYLKGSTFLPLIESIKQSGLHNPIYTVYLGGGDFQKSELHKVDEKIEEIKKQYLQMNKKNVKVDLIGYSRGACIAFCSGLNKKNFALSETGPIVWGINNKDALNSDIGKVILIGGNVTSRFGLSIDLKSLYASSIFEIRGSRDFLDPFTSQLPPQQQCTFNSGHLDLLFSDSVHKKVIEWL